MYAEEEERLQREASEKLARAASAEAKINTTGYHYRGRVQNLPVKIDINTMDSDATIAYTIAFVELRENLVRRATHFPGEKLRASDAWLYPLGIIETAMEHYLTREAMVLQAMPRTAGREERDDFIIRAFDFSITHARKLFTFGEPDGGGGNKIPKSKGGPLTFGEGRANPNGCQEDPRTWEVVPQAQALLNDFVVMAELYKFDGRLCWSLCELNTMNMICFLNSFSMEDKDPEAASNIAMGFVTTKLLGMKQHDGPTIRNMGTPWWKDPVSYRDKNQILLRKHEMPRGGASSSGQQTRGRHRDRSRTRDGGGPPGNFKGNYHYHGTLNIDDTEIIAILDRARGDLRATESLSADELYSMMTAVVRMHKQGTLRDPGHFNNPGYVPHCRDYIKGCSYVNLVKLCYIQKVNFRLGDILQLSMEGRRASGSIDGLIGEDLTHCMAGAYSIQINEAEHDRVGTNHSNDATQLSMKLCKFYPKNCQSGDGCWHIHDRSNN